MPYVRKTEDEWLIESNCGYGWDLESRETDWHDAKANYLIYKKECPYPVRLRKVRVKKGA